MFILVSLYFILAIAFSIFLLDMSSVFIDIKSLFFMLSSTLFFTYGITSTQAIKNAFLLLLKEENNSSKQNLKSARFVFLSIGNIGLLTGTLMALIDLVALFISMNVLSDINANGAGITLSLVYGVTLKTICYASQLRFEILLLKD